VTCNSNNATFPHFGGETLRLLTDNSTIPNRVRSVMELFRQQIQVRSRAPHAPLEAAPRV
jgi:hypothetical protein